MSRGRKASEQNSLDWEGVFYNSVGTYVQIINRHLEKFYNPEPLSKHIRILGGYAFKSSAYKKKGIPIVRISDFADEKIILQEPVFYDESEQLRRFELEEGDIVIALTGGTIAKLSIVQGGLGKLYLNQRVGKFEVISPDEFEKEYVYWIARSVQSIIKNLAWGAAIPNVSPKQIEEIEFPIPDKKTQKQIVDFLNALKNKSINSNVFFDKGIEDIICTIQHKQITLSNIKREILSQNDLLKKLRQQLLQDAMQGKLVKQEIKDGHAKDLLLKIKAEKAKLIAEKKINKEKELPPIKPEEIPFEIPQNWLWCRLGDVCSKIGSGSTPKGSDYTTNGFPFFRSQNIHNNGLEYDDIKFISDSVQKQMRGTTVLANDILLNITGGSMGRCSMVPNDFKEGNVSQHVCIIRPIHLNKSFIHNVIKSKYFQKLIFSSTTGAGREGLPKYNLEQFLVPIPPSPEQERIVIKLNEINSMCDEIESLINFTKQKSELLSQHVLQDTLIRN